MKIFDLFIELLVKLTQLELYMYCFTILVVIATFGFVKRLMSC